MRPTWRVFATGVCGSLVLLALWFRPVPVPLAEAQGIGIFSRQTCATLTGQIGGQTFCFEGASNTLKFWDGATWVQAATASAINGVSIRDYGAVCDGATDDSTAVRNAVIAATASTLNRIIVVPPTSTSCLMNSTIANDGLKRVVFWFTGAGDFSGPGAPGNANKVQWTPFVGGTATMFVQNNSGTEAIEAIANGGGIAIQALVNSGSGIALRADNVSTSSASIVGASTGFYAGQFFNITNLGSDAANANAIGLVGQSVYSNAMYAQQGAVSGPGSTLAANNQYPASYVTRVVGSLNGFNYTAPLIRGDDTTTSTGPLFVLSRQGASGASGLATVTIVNSDGTAAFGTATVLNTAAFHFENNVANNGLLFFNNNGPTAGVDGASTTFWIGGRNAAGTSSNVSIEALTNAGAAADMLIRSGSTGNKVGFGTQQMVVKNTGGVIVGSLSNTAQGTGTLVVASATYANAQAVIVASASGPNIQNLRGISQTGIAARNLRGTCTFAAAVTCSVTFANNEPDASYFATTGCPVTVSAKAVSGFTMTATGTNSNACDWIIFR